MEINGNDQRLAAATAAQLQQTGAKQTLLPKSSQQQDASKSSSTDTVHSFGGDKVSIKVELPQNTIDTLKRIGNTSDILNSLATNLRQTHEGLTAANAITEKMKASLDVFVKTYPPYPVEDKGRMEQLMGYSSLRKQLQGLMIPAPPVPLYEKVKHLWEGMTGGVGGAIQTPDLPQDAPDSHLKNALDQLNVISGQINLVQESMANFVTKD